MITGQKVAKKKLVRGSLDNLGFSLTLLKNFTVNNNDFIFISHNEFFRSYTVWLSGKFLKIFINPVKKNVKIQRKISSGNGVDFVQVTERK